ncbi:biotin--[acetyl-CoA-carboxylase] ligase [Tessaracoccus flavus]|uniref:biotin--[acetyl-CoA-carboxylase] ligase n=1 Tax=Tessaracoccus flavus TaxID=1610493 RepID=UPI001D043375|nr:biotin--[acetyl-CoA-carboxylase] ligase [Tessaracoccus flavus]
MSPDLPDARRIRDLLRASMWGPLEVVPTTGSTNADLAERARSGAPEGAVLIASEQTAGRGRLDRQWVSPAGSSVSMSLLLRPTPAFPQWGWLSLLAGMAVAAALSDVASSAGSVTLKWPNDVLIGGGRSAASCLNALSTPTEPGLWSASASTLR